MSVRQERKDRVVRLCAELAQERANIEQLVSETVRVLEETADRELSSLEVRGMADLVHDFYTGIEKTLRRIAPVLNGGLPEGEFWHRQLLDSMAMDIPDLRPPVLADRTVRDLGEFLRFRHLFRNLYGFELEPDRVRDLASRVEALWKQVEQDLAAFDEFLTELIRS